MIKIDNIEVAGFDTAIRGMRNAMDSHHLSDSREYLYMNAFESESFFSEEANRTLKYIGGNAHVFELGPNDKKLASGLILAGTDEAKFARQIYVGMDITAPLYFLKELDQYKISTTSNSESTMHKIMSKPFDIDLFSFDHIRKRKKNILQLPNEIDEDLEEWINWPLNELYQVSNQGRIKRKEYTTSHKRTWTERILTNTKTADKYLKVGVFVNGQKKDIRVHQMVAQSWIQNPNKYEEVNHKNGNKLDNRVENLEWCSRSKNMIHAFENNLIVMPVYKGKLSKDKRDEIIHKYNTTNISKRSLAYEYNVSHTTINSLINNKYNYSDGYDDEYEIALNLINKLNELRDEWLITKDKEVWYSLIQLLPSAWNQKRTWTANYQVLRNIYFARRNHKLAEWRDFCSMIEKLPYASDLITISKE